MNKIKSWRLKRKLVRLLMKVGSSSVAEGRPWAFPTFRTKKEAQAYMELVLERNAAPGVDKWAVVAKHMEGSGPRSVVRTQYVERVDASTVMRDRRAAGKANSWSPWTPPRD